MRTSDAIFRLIELAHHRNLHPDDVHYRKALNRMAASSFFETPALLIEAVRRVDTDALDMLVGDLAKPLTDAIKKADQPATDADEAAVASARQATGTATSATDLPDPVDVSERLSRLLTASAERSHGAAPGIAAVIKLLHSTRTDSGRLAVKEHVSSLLPMLSSADRQNVAADALRSGGGSEALALWAPHVEDGRHLAPENRAELLVYLLPSFVSADYDDDARSAAWEASERLCATGLPVNAAVADAADDCGLTSWWSSDEATGRMHRAVQFLVKLLASADSGAAALLTSRLQLAAVRAVEGAEDGDWSRIFRLIDGMDPSLYPAASELAVDRLVDANSDGFRMLTAFVMGVFDTEDAELPDQNAIAAAMGDAPGEAARLLREWLARAEDGAAVQELLQHRSSRPELLEPVAKWLDRLDVATAASWLVDIVNDMEVELGWLQVAGLAEVAWSPLHNHLSALLREGDPQVAYRAADVLAAAGATASDEEAVVDSITAMLNGDVVSLRARAAVRLATSLNHPSAATRERLTGQFLREELDGHIDAEMRDELSSRELLERESSWFRRVFDRGD